MRRPAPDAQMPCCLSRTRSWITGGPRPAAHGVVTAATTSNSSGRAGRENISRRAAKGSSPNQQQDLSEQSRRRR